MADSLAANASRSGERLFFSGMALAMAAVVFAGFMRTFFLRPLFPEAAALAASEPVFYFHGAVFSAWIVLLIVQTSFIRAGAVGRHMALGKAGAVLAAAMVVIGVHAGIVAAQRPEGFVGVPVPPLSFLIVPFGDMVLFAGFVTTAFLMRARPQTHKRLMLLATASLLLAATARIAFSTPMLAGIPFIEWMLVDVFVLALLVWDMLSARRPHPVTLIGGLILIASHPLRVALWDSPAWLGFASRLTGVQG